MTLAQLKQTVKAYQDGLRDKDGSVVVFSETGPANMGVIDALLSFVESQERRIELLEQRTPK